MLNSCFCTRFDLHAASPSCHGVRRRLRTGQVASSSLGQPDNAHTCTCSQPSVLQHTVQLMTCMFLHCGKKQEYPVKEKVFSCTFVSFFRFLKYSSAGSYLGEVYFFSSVLCSPHIFVWLFLAACFGPFVQNETCYIYLTLKYLYIEAFYTL